MYPEKLTLPEASDSFEAEMDAAIKSRDKEDSAQHILDMINPSNSHPDHLSSEDFFG